MIKENKLEISVSNVEQILQTSSSKLAEVNIAIKINSEISSREIWFCSNERMGREVRERNLRAITYTINRLEETIKKAPDSLLLEQLQDKFGNSNHKKNEGANR